MQVSTKQLLDAIQQMPKPELDAFVKPVLQLRAQRQAPSLNASESKLLAKINQALPELQQQRFDQLVARRQALTITNTELDELIDLTEKIEQLDVERIEALAELAQLRYTSLTQVMQDLGIQPPVCG